MFNLNLFNQEDFYSLINCSDQVEILQRRPSDWPFVIVTLGTYIQQSTLSASCLTKLTPFCALKTLLCAHTQRLEPNEQLFTKLLSSPPKICKWEGAALYYPGNSSLVHINRCFYLLISYNVWHFHGQSEIPILHSRDSNFTAHKSWKNLLIQYIDFLTLK